jgi:cytochrome P450
MQQLMDKQYVFSYELTKETLDKKQLTDQLLSILLAGRDTTANTLSIAFFHMAKNPEIWNKIRKGVLALEGRRPSYDDLKSMTYMSWVLNESKFLQFQNITYETLIYVKPYACTLLFPST